MAGILSREDAVLLIIGLGLWCLMSLSTIFYSIHLFKLKHIIKSLKAVINEYIVTYTIKCKSNVFMY
jgi:cobalamin biosynthesis protein CobD/CbiB